MGIGAQSLNLLVVGCDLVCEAIVGDGTMNVSFELFDSEVIPYVSLRSCSTSYLRPASCSMIFLPSAIASGSVALVTARYTSSMDWVWSRQQQNSIEEHSDFSPE